MFILPSLPYNLDALSPFLSEKQIDLHYNKHHKGYIDKLNTIIRNGPIKYESLEDIIRLSAAYAPSLLYNSAAQAFNHDIYWKSMLPSSQSIDPVQASITLNYTLERSFGNLQVFKETFISEANKFFGSGWIWLIWDKLSEKLGLMTTHDAGCPIIDRNLVILFNCDLWEHSWYVSYENRKEDYLKSFIDHLVNWKFAAENFENRIKLDKKPEFEFGRRIN